jgi:hypothetical protein
MLKRFLLGLLVLWSGVSLLGEARGALTSWDARAQWETQPDAWRFGSPPVARLEVCLDAARRLVPPGSKLLFAVPGEPPDRALFARRWAAYLMPARNVFGPGEGAARYILSWRLPLAGPELAGARPVRQLPGCFLYEVNTEAGRP